MIVGCKENEFSLVGCFLMGCFILTSKNQAQASSFSSSVYSFFATTPVVMHKCVCSRQKIREWGGGGSYSHDICRAKEVLAPNRHQKNPVPLYIPYFFMGYSFEYITVCRFDE